jgi:hypothetical protein
MQILIQIVCKKGPALRGKIAEHGKLTAESGLKVVKHFKQNAVVQYTLLKLPGFHGSVRMYWDPATQTLSARVVTQEGGKPGPILGAFVGFVLGHFRKRVKTVSIVPLD